MQEFLWPILFIIILALIKYMAAVTTVRGKAIEDFPVETIYAYVGGEILVVPNNASTHVLQVNFYCTDCRGA